MIYMVIVIQEYFWSGQSHIVYLMLALNSLYSLVQSFCLSLPSTEILCRRHHA